MNSPRPLSVFSFVILVAILFTSHSRSGVCSVDLVEGSSGQWRTLWTIVAIERCLTVALLDREFGCAADTVVIKRRIIVSTRVVSDQDLSYSQE